MNYGCAFLRNWIDAAPNARNFPGYKNVIIVTQRCVFWGHYSTCTITMFYIVTELPPQLDNYGTRLEPHPLSIRQIN